MCKMKTHQSFDFKWTEHVSIVRLIALTGKACWLYVQLLCSLVRSTCNLERVWIPMLLFPDVSGHSRSKYRVNENWRFEVIVTFLKTLFWILTGFFWFRKVTCLASIFMNSCIKLKAWQTVWSEWRCLAIKGKLNLCKHTLTLAT